MFKRKKKKAGCETPKYSRFSMAPNPNLGWQPVKSSDTKPPKPPTSGSNAVKPNPNYVPPASVAKAHPIVCAMNREDLDDWVKTRAQIGDVAYCHDCISDHHYIYRYRKPDDNPFWVMMQPDFLEKYSKKENEGDNKMNITGICTYETPCGWCTKWDKKCDKKIGYCTDNKPQRGLRANVGIFLEDAMDSELDDIRSGKGLSRLDTNLDPNKPLPSGIRKE